MIPDDQIEKIVNVQSFYDTPISLHDFLTRLWTECQKIEFNRLTSDLMDFEEGVAASIERRYNGYCSITDMLKNPDNDILYLCKINNQLNQLKG
jgi:hypothetical protein